MVHAMLDFSDIHTSLVGSLVARPNTCEYQSQNSEFILPNHLYIPSHARTISNLLPIPDGIPDEKVLYLSDVLPTSYHTVVDTGVKEGDTVGVWVHLRASYLNMTYSDHGRLNRVWALLVSVLRNGLS